MADKTFTIQKSVSHKNRNLTSQEKQLAREDGEHFIKVYNRKKKKMRWTIKKSRAR